MYIVDRVVAESCRFDEAASQAALEKIAQSLSATFETLKLVEPTLDTNLALIEKLGAAIAGDETQRRKFIRCYFPILKHEHLILGNIFTVKDYLSESRFVLFKDFLELSPYGQHKQRLYSRLSEIGVDIDRCISPCRSEDLSKPSDYVAQLMSVFFGLFANAKGSSVEVAYRLFNRYSCYRDSIFAHCIRLDAGKYASSRDTPSNEEAAGDRSDLTMLDRLMHLFIRALLEEHQQATSAFHRVCKIFEQKSSYASMHHKRVNVNGKNLALVFSGESFDAVGFTKEILRSSWFDRENPSNSTFFKNLTAFGKPMFGVFTEEELADIKSGVASDLDSVLDTPLHRHVDLLSSVVKDIEALRQGRAVRPPVPEKSLELRSMYHQLINRKHTAELDSQCLQYVRAVVGKAKSMNVAKELGVEFSRFAYSRSTLLQKLDAIYKTQMQTAESVNSVDIDLGTLKAMHFTFAPTSFIDGCWLENVPKVFEHNPNITGKLFDIYFDELGSGVYKYNHVRIFAELLQELEIELPSPYSLEFAQHPAIVDNAFTNPVFMMAMSRHTGELLPEILGFTLSVELFGLGGFYQYLLAQLQRHKIDANFYSIHISVDNFSTGHSSMAAKAVINYMEGICERVQSNDIANLLWNRVWDGFLASRYLLK